MVRTEHNAGVGDPDSGLGVVWFRRDLRLRDNPAWARATHNHDRVLAVFIEDPRLMARAGSFRRHAIEAALAGLDAALDGGLLIRSGDPQAIVAALMRTTGAQQIYWNSDVTPFATARDQAVIAALRRTPVSANAESTGTGTARPDPALDSVNTSWGSLIHPPRSILTAKGSVPKVFGAFWKRWQQLPLPAEAIAAPVIVTMSEREMVFDPTVHATTDEVRAAEQLDEFIVHRLAAYPEHRDLPAEDGTSRLSVALKLGTISPAAAARAGAASPHGSAFVRQLAWRDWFAHLLHDEPRLVNAPQRPDRAPQWRDAPEEFAAWKAGRTGFPLVDAGMRELRATGLMHNRVRMVAASFLVKDLLIDWRQGERYFRHLLVDGDVAQNVGNWQWVAGTGPDAAPYFRVFNPTRQSERFDARGGYIRRWVPELAALDDRSIHEPARCAPLDLAAAGITLGLDYPFPIVEHAQARQRALDAYGR